MDLEHHILATLRNRGVKLRPVTIGDLARELGATHAVVLAAARRLVAEGRATPSMVLIRGVSTLHGLTDAGTAQQPAPDRPSPIALESPSWHGGRDEASS